MITEKSPKRPRHKKYEENTELKFWNNDLFNTVLFTVNNIYSFLWNFDS